MNKGMQEGNKIYRSNILENHGIISRPTPHRVDQSTDSHLRGSDFSHWEKWKAFRSPSDLGETGRTRM